MSDHQIYSDIPFDLNTETPEPVSARSVERGARVGYGISYTVPNQDMGDTFVAWLYAIDSLYLTIQASLKDGIESRLRLLQQKANRRDTLHEAQFQIGDHIFEVKPRGRNYYKVVLSGGSYEIELLGPSNAPLFSVKVLSARLHTASLLSVEAELRLLLEDIAINLETPMPTRADLHLDFSYHNESIAALNAKCFVSLAKKKNQYTDSDDITGWIIGAGGTTMARIYEKSREISQRDKGYPSAQILQELWSKEGWDGNEPVWRIEFQLRKDALQAKDINTVSQLDENHLALWSDLTSRWFKICIPSETDQKRSRWPEHPLSSLIHLAPMKMGYVVPLERKHLHQKGPSKAYLAERLVLAASSYGVVCGAENIAGVNAHSIELLRNLDMRKGPKDRCLAAVMTRTINLRYRDYNLRLNGVGWQKKVGFDPTVEHSEDEVSL